MFPSLSITKISGVCALVAVSVATVAQLDHGFSLKPFVANLSSEVPRMLELVNQTRLPDQSEYASVPSTAGIGLDVLKHLQREWTNDFDWHREEATINK